MITTPYEKIQNDLRSIPKEQLMSMGNNPSPQYPVYMIATEMQRRVQEEKAMAAQQTRDQAGQPTVVEGVMDEFANTGGLSQAQPMMAMNQQMPQEGIQMMATGGRVGYQKGKIFNYSTNDRLANILERDEFANLNLPEGGFENDEELAAYLAGVPLDESPIERMVRQINEQREVEENAEGLEEFSAMDAPFNLAEIAGERFDEAGMPIAGAVLGLGSYGRYLNPKNWIKGGLQGLGKIAKRRGWKSGQPKRGPGAVKTTYKTKRTFKPNKNGPDKRWNNKKQEWERGTWESKKIPSSTGTETGKGRPIPRKDYDAGVDAAKKAGKYATGIGTAGGIGYGGYQAWDNILSPEARQADQDAINAEELAFRESQEAKADERAAMQARIDAKRLADADALIEQENKDNEMSLQALANQKEKSAQRDKEMQGLDMARFGLSIAGARNISELSEGLGGIVTDMQTRRREDQEYERGDELIQAQIGQLKALSESYAVKGEFTKVRELNDFATNASNVLNQLTMSGKGPDDPSYIALSEQLSLALMEISKELGLYVDSESTNNTTANQNTIGNSPYVNNP